MRQGRKELIVFALSLGVHVCVHSTSVGAQCPHDSPWTCALAQGQDGDHVNVGAVRRGAPYVNPMVGLSALSISFLTLGT